MYVCKYVCTCMYVPINLFFYIRYNFIQLGPIQLRDGLNGGLCEQNKIQININKVKNKCKYLLVLLQVCDFHLPIQ